MYFVVGSEMSLKTAQLNTGVRLRKDRSDYKLLVKVTLGSESYKVYRLNLADMQAKLSENCLHHWITFIFPTFRHNWLG